MPANAASPEQALGINSIHLYGRARRSTSLTTSPPFRQSCGKTTDHSSSRVPCESSNLASIGCSFAKLFKTRLTKITAKDALHSTKFPANLRLHLASFCLSTSSGTLS